MMTDTTGVNGKLVISTAHLYQMTETTDGCILKFRNGDEVFTCIFMRDPDPKDTTNIKTILIRQEGDPFPREYDITICVMTDVSLYSLAGMVLKTDFFHYTLLSHKKGARLYDVPVHISGDQITFYYR